MAQPITYSLQFDLKLISKKSLYLKFNFNEWKIMYSEKVFTFVLTEKNFNSKANFHEKQKVLGSKNLFPNRRKIIFTSHKEKKTSI